MQGPVWKRLGGVLLPSLLCVSADLLLRLQPELLPDEASLQLHAGWESSPDCRPGPSPCGASFLQVGGHEHGQ